VGLKEKIKGSAGLKKLVLWMLMPTNQARPRLWVQWFVNPFYHKKGKGSKVCRRVRMDVLPFNPFELGKNSTIEDFSVVNNGVGAVTIGNDTRIGLGNVLIGPVKVGSQVIFAQNVVLSGLNHGYEAIDTPIRLQKVTTTQIVIEDEVWIGANAVLTAGITVGKHSVIAGGSVVVKNVPPYCVVGGNPAKILKQYNADTKQWERPAK